MLYPLNFIPRNKNQAWNGFPDEESRLISSMGRQDFSIS